MVCLSEKGGVTSEIFRDALASMDALNLFPWSPTLTPFAIFDGHGSRLEYPFLEYTNCKNMWSICVGVPL